MISEFRGRWTRLSNYSLCSVWFDGHIYSSVEHAYQAAKTLDEDERRAIRYLPTPNQAKKAGQTVTLRTDWEQVKIQIMRELLVEKFSQEPEKQVLLSTGNVELIEGNWWGDRFWGQSPLGVGENWLGRLLMDIRRRIKLEKSCTLKALTIKQPWAWWLFHGKPTENRNWQISGPFPQYIAIHAGKAMDATEFVKAEIVSGLWIPPDDPRMVYGSIIGSVEVVSCYADRTRTVWDVPGQWHWRIDNVHEYATPITCRGQLGLWTVSEEVLSLIEIQEQLL